MEECRVLLRKSISCYSRMLEHAHNFNETIDRNGIHVEDINEYNERLSRLQTEAEMVDRELMELLEEKSDLFVSDLLIEKRTELVRELIHFNEVMIPRLSSIMAITRDEMNKVRQGIGHISGYHSGTRETTGSIIRSHT